MKLIHITHKNLPDGVLIAEREFDPLIHTRFGEAPKGAPVGETAAGDEGDATKKGKKPKGAPVGE